MDVTSTSTRQNSSALNHYDGVKWLIQKVRFFVLLSVTSFFLILFVVSPEDNRVPRSAATAGHCLGSLIIIVDADARRQLLYP